MNILMAFDGSINAQAAAALVQDLFHPCLRGQTCRLTAMTVLPTQHFSTHESMQRALDGVEVYFGESHLPVQTILKTGSPAASLIEQAEEMNADLIVMGAQGLRATLGILLGGVAQQVVEYAHRPVLIVRGPYDGIRKVLVVVDGSPYSTRAVEYLAPACSEAEAEKASMPGPRIHGLAGEGAKPAVIRARCSWLQPQTQIILMHVTQPALPPETAARAWTLGPEILYPAPLTPVDIQALMEQERQAGQRILRQGREALEAAGMPVQTVMLDGDAATEIIRFARENAVDLIVCGSRGLTLLGGWLLGSVSRKLVHYGPCSVLVVKGE